MGPSGTGKSTIFQLMMRLYDPDSGTVLLDGIDLKKLDLSWLRGQISYVNQEPLLFSASIRENLLIGKPSASEEELWSALKKAEIADFVN
jgi:ABC-type multidrug transport system fused ATPase/permease subunit